jgi:hypothetical protein
MPARVKTLAGAVVAAVVLAGAAAAEHVDDTIIGRKSASGRHPAATAIATTDVRVRKIAVRVSAKPNQRASGSWAIFCGADYTAYTRDADRFGGRTPLTVAVRMPTNFAGATASCKLVGTASVPGRGRLTVELVARS